ncbi:MAG: type I-C CRISPR-associated protein Cas8c/Csd1 [Acutalibacteraceae bacterium]
MVIHSLTKLYEVLAEKNKVDKLGWAKSKVSYGLSIDENGRLTNIISLKTTDKSGKKEIASQISLPMPVKRSVNIAANFLYDTASYFFGNDRKGNPQRNRQCFETSKSLHHKLLADDNSAAAKAILKYYENVDIDNIENYLSEIGCSENVITDIFKNGANLVFMPFGRLAVDYNDICECWNSYYGISEAETGICLVTGKRLPISKLHPVIKGVRGGQSMGTSLVSFNAPAFESFEKSQGQNSPVSEYASFAYTTALNYLLSESDYVNYFGDTTVVCWTDDENEGCQKLFSDVFGDNDELKQKDLWNAIRKISMGQSVEWNSIPIDPKVKFYILGLSPNAARLSVRFFLVNTFGSFMKNIVQHEEDMRIAIPDFLNSSHFPVWKVLRETVNQNSKNKSAKPQLAGSYIYSILTGCKYPETLYNNIMIRVNAERNVKAERSSIRASVIKAYLVRNHTEYKEVLTVALNTETKNEAYNLGRLFAILEEIQSMANPGINATIKDRYFSSASSTPAAIFPFLVDLAQKHLKKIRVSNPGFCVAKQKEISDILSKFEENLPARMTMQEKGAFQIGYYHQTQYRYTKKEDK